MSNQTNLPYKNRELSWLDFNYRVLEEALETENPIMERVRFLGISASNLDEFFMVRVAGVKAQIHSGCQNTDPSGLSPSALFAHLQQNMHAFVEKQYSCFRRSVLPALKKQHIVFLKPDELNQKQAQFVSDYFHKVLFPVLTPLAVDESRPFPLLGNKTLNLAVRLKGQDDEACFALVQAPSILPRFLELPCQKGRAFILLEQIIAFQIGELFELHSIEACTPFRLTRNSDLDIDEEAEDLLLEIEKSIKKRKRGRPVRLEIAHKCDKLTRKFLIDALKVKDCDIYAIHGPLDLTFLSKFANLDGCEHLCFDPVVPVYPPAEFFGQSDMFDAIKQKDRLLHHPYESFQCVVDFVRQAAQDENVLAIKQTLYRVSGNSPIVAALMKAAENGKQVTVLVELKARFDEENNILWAKKLEEAGCHVIYGLVGLKTHCKILLVVRREDDGIYRYVHMGTGNYNDSTAKIYTDLSLFTCKEPYGTDASSLFNVLTGYSRPPQYRKFEVAPHGLRDFFVQMIEREIDHAKQNLPCGITMKVNSLVDPEMIALLYRASCCGVKIQLMVRGICCLIPGVPGVSELISVHSIVGQLLEHSRIYRFENAGDPCIFMGSADLMQRNLDHRVELVVPIEEHDLKERAFAILQTLLDDTLNTRVMLSDTVYSQIDMRSHAPFDAQHAFCVSAKQAVEQLKALDDLKPYTPIRRADLDKMR